MCPLYDVTLLKKMKALFLQTKLCEIPQIRINLNFLGLVVSKHGQIESYNQTLVTQTSGVLSQNPFSIHSMWFSTISLKQSTSVTRHIIDGNVWLFPIKWWEGGCPF